MKISPYPEKVSLNKYYFLRTRSELLLRIIYIIEEISPVKYVGILIDKEDKFKNKKILVDKKHLLIFHPKTRLFQHLMSIPEFRGDFGIRKTLCILGFPVDKVMVKMENKKFDTSDCEISCTEFEYEYSNYLKYDETGPFLSGNTFITDPLKLVVPGVNSLNVYRLYVIVCRNGGMERITNDQKWKPLFYSEMKKTNVSYTVRTFYKKYLYEFEYLRRIKIKNENFKNRNINENETDLSNDKTDSCKINSIVHKIMKDNECSGNNEMINTEIKISTHNLNDKYNKVLCEVTEKAEDKLNDRNDDNVSLRRTDVNKTEEKYKDRNNDNVSLKRTELNKTEEKYNNRNNEKLKDKNSEKNLNSDAIITRISVDDHIFSYKYRPYQVVMLITENGERYYGVVKLRRNKGLNMYYVQFVGWNKEYNEWYCEDVLDGVIIGTGGCKLTIEDIFIAMGNKKPSRSSKANYLIDDPLIREKHCHNVSKVSDRKDSEGSDSDKYGSRVLNMYGEKGFRDRRYNRNMECDTENIRGVKYRGIINKGVLDREECYNNLKGVSNNRDERYCDYKGVLDERYYDYNDKRMLDDRYYDYNDKRMLDDRYYDYNNKRVLDERYYDYNDKRVLDERYYDYNNKRVLGDEDQYLNIKRVLNTQEMYSNHKRMLDEEHYTNNKRGLIEEDDFVDYKGVLDTRNSHYNIKGRLNRNGSVSSTLNCINSQEQEIKDLSINEKYISQGTNIYSNSKTINITNLRKLHPSGMNISKEKKICSDKSNLENSCHLNGNKRCKGRISEEKPMPTMNYVKKYFRWFKGDWDTEEMRKFMACVGLNGVNDLNENNYMFMK